MLDLLDILNEYSSKLKSSDNTDLIVELMIIRLISSKDLKSLDSRIRSLEANNEKDLLSLVNRLVDDKLSKLDLSKYENISNTNKTDTSYQVKNNKDIELVKNPNLEKDYETTLLSEQEEDEAPLDEIVDNSNTEDNLDKLTNKLEESRSINIPSKMVDDIRDMIINTAGRMLKPMFEKDGFNYIYRPGEFVLYLKDEFYAIFIQTKTDDIGKEINDILDDEVIFSVDNYSHFIDNKDNNTNIEKSDKLEIEEKKTKKSQKLDENNETRNTEINNTNDSLVKEEDTKENLSNLDRLKKIFKEELIVK